MKDFLQKKATVAVVALCAAGFVSLSFGHVTGAQTPPAKKRAVSAKIPKLPSTRIPKTVAEPAKPLRAPFEIRENARVSHYVHRWTKKKPENFAALLERSSMYVPELRDALRAEGIPPEFAYVPMIESGFNVRAVSKKNAVGLWQFIKPTGLKYGLKIDQWVDERMDAEKSTAAAARYMNAMFDRFESWELVMAGYNCGEKRVDKAIKKTGSTDFWTLSKKLPRETRNYVPKIHAALTIASNPKLYGFETPKARPEKDYETVAVPPRKSLADIAKLLGVKSEELYARNPSLVGRTTPPGGDYELSVPREYAPKLRLIRNDVVALADLEHPLYRNPSLYRVRTDDSLWKIARKFGTSVRSIKRLNHISGSIIHPGQKLKIPGTRVAYVRHRVRPGESLYSLARKYRTSIAEIRKANNIKGSIIRAGKELTIPRDFHAGAYSARHVPVKMSHRIRPGDTLSKIALRYRVSVSQIQEWNKLSSTILIAGRNLLIYQ